MKSYSHTKLITPQILFLLVILTVTGMLLAGDKVITDYQTPKKKLVFGCDQNYPPYEFFKYGKPDGFNADLIYAIAREMKLDVEIRGDDWSNILKGFQEGEIDVVAGLLYTPEREKTIDFSMPHSMITYAIFTPPGKEIVTINDLKDMNIIVQKDDIMDEYVQTKFHAARVTRVTTGPEAIQLLATGNYDAALMSKVQGIYKMNDIGQNFDIHPLPYPPMEYCFAVRQGDIHLQAKLNEGLAVLKMSGEYQKIYTKWFGVYKDHSSWDSIRIYIYGLVILINLFIVSIIWSWFLRKKIKEKSNELRQIIDLVPFFVFAKDENGKFIFANKALADAYNLSVDEITGLKQSELHYDSAELEKFEEAENKVFDENYKKLESFENFTTKLNEKLVLQTRRVPMYMSGDLANKYVLGVSVDFTEQSKVEQTLIKSENKFKQVVEQAVIPIIIHDFNGKILQVNYEAGIALGYKRDELLSLTIFDIEIGKKHDELIELWKNVRKGKVITNEGFHRRKDGSIFAVESNLGLISTEEEEMILLVSRNVDERRRWESQIKLQSEALEAAANGIVITNYDGVVVWINKSFTELTGYSRDEFIGLHTRTLKSGLHKADFYKNLWDTIKSGNVWQGELINKRKDGTLYYELANITPVMDETGKITHFISVKADITARKETERIVKDNEQRYKYLFTMSPIGIFQYDTNLVLLDFNDKFIKIFRSTREKLMHLDLNKLVDQSFVPTLHQGLLGEDGYYRGHYHTTTSDVDIYISFHTRPYFTENNNINGGIGIVEDITDITIMERELKESEEKYRSIFENLSDIYYMSDMEGKIINVSPSVKQLINVKNEKDLLGLNLTDTFFKDAEKRQVLLDLLLEYKQVKNYPVTLTKPDGSVFYLEANSHMVFDKNNIPVAVEGMIRDVTERKTAENEMRYSENKLRNIVENSYDGIMLIDEKGIVVEWNQGMTAISGLLRNEAVNRFLWDILLDVTIHKELKPDYPAKLKKYILSFLSTGTLPRNKDFLEFSVKDNEGQVRVVQSSIAYVVTDRGNLVVAIARDISLHKEAEANLLYAKEEAEKSNKLKSEFLAQMSHEIRTPINAILSFSGLIKEDLEDKIPEDLNLGFEAINRAGKRIIRTIDLILNMSEIQTGTYDFNLSDINIQIDILENLYYEFSTFANENNITIEMDFQAENKMIKGDEYTVNQIFNNLIDNAIKYTPSGKVIMRTIDIENKVAVEIEDTGIGISEEYLPILFEPFTQEEQGYTRKFEGNGLGLALVKKYCELNKAEISVVSKKGKGTKFRVVFGK